MGIVETFTKLGIKQVTISYSLGSIPDHKHFVLIELSIAFQFGGRVVTPPPNLILTSGGICISALITKSLLYKSICWECSLESNHAWMIILFCLLWSGIVSSIVHWSGLYKQSIPRIDLVGLGPNSENIQLISFTKSVERSTHLICVSGFDQNK